MFRVSLCRSQEKESTYVGTRHSVAHPFLRPWPNEVEAYLSDDRPLIISLLNQSNGAQHAVVVSGISGTDDYVIHYMDPDPQYDGFIERTYKELISGFDYGLIWYNTLIIGDALYPQHCFNLKCDEDEDDVDCGGKYCPPCQVTPPPPNTCSNCKKNPGETEIDCGGPCPSCQDVPEERVIDNAVYYNSHEYEVMAIKKITAGKYGVGVRSGAKVSYITEETGTIILVPGFSAYKGSEFSTQRKDLSEYSRKCPVKLCTCEWFPSKITGSPGPGGMWFGIYDLLYAEKIEYEIYDDQGRFIYGDVKNVTHNGDVGLWNCLAGAIITQGTVTYTIYCTVHFCNGDKRNYTHKFVVTILSRSSTDDPDTPDPSFSPPANNITLQTETPAPTFSIIPNPNPGTFQIETNFPLTDILHTKVVNLLGVTVYEAQNPTSNTIQLPAFASGQHFVMVMLKDGTVLTQKMMLQR